MRIGVFVTGAFSRQDRLDWVSGHVQIPLMAARILSSAGHQVTLITTRQPEADCLPYELPQTVEVAVVQHASSWSPEHRVYAGKALSQVRQLLALMRDSRFEVIHFFGGMATGWLLCGLKSMGVRSVAFYSPIRRPPQGRSKLRNGILRGAFGRVSRILATADYVSAGWAAVVGAENTGTLYPGIMKQMSGASALADRNSILFLREASHDNGVDLALASFRKLAPKYPHTRFVFAVRPYEEYKEPLLQLGRQIENVNVHVYPYDNGVSLADLLGKARFVVQPFRSLSINPQVSLLEALCAGVPVIATAVESNPEVVHHEENGLLIPPDDERALLCAAERLLNDTPLLTRLTQNARHVTEERWNWDGFGRQLLRVYDEL